MSERDHTFRPQDYHSTFDPDAYLQHYFGQSAIEEGTRVSLFALPVFAHIVMQTMKPDERENLLDVGAGPTVYSALCFRDAVKTIYLTDYVEKNLEILRDWSAGTSIYDWSPTIKVIKRTEGGPPPDEQIVEAIEAKSRNALKAGGVHFADVHESPVVPYLGEKQMDVVVTIFTLESACQNYEQYRKALGNILRHLRSGGRFVLGSVLEDDSYNSGKGLIFSLLHLSEEMILNALAEHGIDMNSVKKYVLEDEGVMFLMAAKL